MSFFAELKRRAVIRVGVAYLVASWLLLQITDVLSSILGLPPTTGKLVFMLLLIGFLPALVFAWVYQVTPEGLRRDSGGQGVSLETARNLDRATIAMLMVVAALVLYDRLRPTEPESAAVPNVPIDGALEPDRKIASENFASTEVAKLAGESAPTIAVLPFVNMSDEAGNEYFADGLSEELLNMLVKTPGLRVAARTSSFSFRDKELTIAEIAEELRVGYVLEGSVRKAGDRVRITAQLIEARDGFHLWSETYDRRMDDIFAVQDEISAAVVGALQLQLLGQTAGQRATQAEVYALYLKALYEFNKATRPGLANAVATLDAALAIEPEYVPALSLRASAYLFQANSGERPLADGFEDARRSAIQSLAIDPTAAFTWGILSYIQAYYDWDFQAALHSSAQMLRLEPNSAESLNTQATLENILGRFDLSIELRERAIQLDPFNIFYRNAQSFTLLATGQYERAVALIHEVLKDAPDNASRQWRLVKVRLLQHDIEGAAVLAETLTPHNRNASLVKATLLHNSGQGEAAQAIVDELLAGDDTGEGHYFRAQFHAWTGDPDAAFEHLARAVDARHRVLAYVLNEPFLFPIHGDPRWREQLARIGLLEAWLEVPEHYGGPAR